MECIYQINGVSKRSKDLDYNDLLFLCGEYYKKNNKFPADKDFRYSNNLPSFGKLKRILIKEEMTKAEFAQQFGCKRNYTSKGLEIEYESFVDKYKRISENIGRPIGEKELKNYSLPRGDWFILIVQMLT